MKALVCRAFGDPEKLSVEDLALEALGENHVKISVRAASLNFFDVLMVQGLYQRKPPFPFVAGTDAAGEVIAVGSAIAGIKVGDRVMAFNWSGGAFAEQMIVPESNVFLLPTSVDYVAAAALKSVYGTALYALTERARLKPGESLLVLGAAGGLGLALVDVGRMLGARVIAAVGSEPKLRLIQKRGFDDVINYATESLRDRVRELTGGNGADVIADPVGGEVFHQAIRSIAWGGRLCVLGFAAGTIAEIATNQVLLKSFDVVGVNYGGWVDIEPDGHRRQTLQLVTWCAEEMISPHVSETIRLSETPAAMRRMLDRSTTGKVVMVP